MAALEDTTITLLRDLVAANHAVVLERLSAQDKTSDTTLREVRKTNGSVAEVIKRVDELEKHNVKVEGINVARSQTRGRLTLALQLLAMVGSGALGGGVGHALHWW